MRRAVKKVPCKVCGKMFHPKGLYRHGVTHKAHFVAGGGKVKPKRVVAVRFGYHREQALDKAYNEGFQKGMELGKERSTSDAMKLKMIQFILNGEAA